MPKYDYHCKECGTVFIDIEHSVADWPLLVCPECTMPALAQELSSVKKTGIKIKDNGLYSPGNGKTDGRIK